MARIRSIKPEFFDDEDLCAFGPWHRLCFEGLWTQADKAGRMEDRPRRLKTRIFPYDDLDFEQLLTDLCVAGFIARYAVDDRKYICVPEASWTEHQRPRRDEHESVLPSAAYATATYSSLDSHEPSAIALQISAPESVGSREVGSREVGSREREDAPASVAPATLSVVPVAPGHRAEDLQELWNTLTTPPIPRCRDLTDDRRRKIRLRLKDKRIEEWAEVFVAIERSSFLRGENDRHWCVSFDWIVKNSEHATRVLEGKYNDRVAPTGSTPKTAGNIGVVQRFIERGRT